MRSYTSLPLAPAWRVAGQLCFMRFQVLTAASMKFRVFWDVVPCSLVEVDRSFWGTCFIIALMIEAVHTSETSVNLNVTTRHYIPEDSKLKLCFTANIYLTFQSYCVCYKHFLWWVWVCESTWFILCCWIGRATVVINYCFEKVDRGRMLIFKSSVLNGVL
jgi:hypothetical protein